MADELAEHLDLQYFVLVELREKLHRDLNADSDSQGGLYTPEEETILKEAARKAFADAEIFDELAEELDLTDKVLRAVRGKLHDDLNGDDQCQDEDRLPSPG